MFSNVINMLFWAALSICAGVAIGCCVVLLLDWTDLYHFDSIDNVPGHFHFFVQYGINLMVGILWLKFRNTADNAE